VAASAMPIGMPGCPDFAASTPSIAKARMALAKRRVSMLMRFPVLAPFQSARAVGNSSGPRRECAAARFFDIL
jgi:hypothetical protein